MAPSVNDRAASDLTPTRETLARIFRMKYGAPESAGWGPSMRRRFDYFNPDDCYEAVVSGLVTDATTWLDIGCGRELFPNNKPLARELSARCRHLAGVDPDSTLQENPYVREKV